MTKHEDNLKKQAEQMMHANLTRNQKEYEKAREEFAKAEKLHREALMDEEK